MAANGQQTKWASIPACATAQRTVNPIRDLVDTMDLSGHPDKPMIPLSIGDPTVFGNLTTADEVLEAVAASLRSHKRDGYPHSAGYQDARAAVAKEYSSEDLTYTAEDVVLASGCSGALDMALGVLCRPGCNVAIPVPGFSLYRTLVEARGHNVHTYQLRPEADWEVDLESLEAAIDEHTVAIVVTNPSNPCGSVYTADHLQAILSVAERKRVPVVADEVYAHMVFASTEFHALAPLAKRVPVLTCGGLAKRYLVPGWRVGWILVHDPVEAFGDIRPGLLKLTQHILGANSIVQGALPAIFEKTPKSFFSSVLTHIESNASLLYRELSAAPGLTPIMPKGAMYLMVGVDPAAYRDIADDVDFTQKLLQEQSVFCLPAKVFGLPNFFRIVTTVPQEKMEEAARRMKEFASAHAK